MRNRLIKAGLDALHAVGAQHWMAPFTRGKGVVLTLHHVRPEIESGFAPNRHLEVTPAFLDEAIGRVRGAGFDLVSMDEAIERLEQEDGDRRFAAFTFDDGYRDNLHHALPVLERHGCPATLYVASDFVAGAGILWWRVVEEALRRRETIRFRGQERRVAASAAKAAAYRAICRAMVADGEPSRDAAVADLARQAGLEPAALCRELCLGWDEVRGLAAHPLITIGAHTRSHPMLAKISLDEARAEIRDGRDRVAAAISAPLRHLAYPIGSSAAAGEREFALARDLGFASAVTTRRGVLRAGHRDFRYSLPRISLNGHLQRARYVDLLLSGAPFAVGNRLLPTQ